MNSRIKGTDREVPMLCLVVKGTEETAEELIPLAPLYDKDQLENFEPVGDEALAEIPALPMVFVDKKAEVPKVPNKNLN